MSRVSDSERLLRETLLFHWDKWDRGVAWRSVPVMALCLGTGIALSSPGGGLVAAAGAFTAGFGSRQPIRGSRLIPMLLATVGMTVSTFIGMLLGHQSLLFVCVAGLWAALYALLTALRGGTSWVGQQCAVYLLVASAFHTTPRGSLDRCSLILAGGLLQSLVSWVVLRWQGQDRVTGGDMESFRELMEGLGGLRECGLMRTPICIYGLRLVLVVAGATEFYRHTGHLSGYWVPMTTLLVLRADFFQTLSRASMRVGGTAIGGWLAGLLAAYLHPTPPVLASLVLFFAWWAYSLVDVNYAVFTLSLTAYIVFLLALAGVPAAEVVHLRAGYTLLGGAIALLAYLDIFRKTRLWIRAQQLALPHRQAA